jgi:hypothetical protein
MTLAHKRTFIRTHKRTCDPMLHSFFSAIIGQYMKGMGKVNMASKVDYKVILCMEKMKHRY